MEEVPRRINLRLQNIVMVSVPSAVLNNTADCAYNGKSVIGDGSDE